MELIRLAKDAKMLRMSAMERRIIITKAVAEIRERLAKSGEFRRSFIATGT